MAYQYLQTEKTMGDQSDELPTLKTYKSTVGSSEIFIQYKLLESTKTVWMERTHYLDIYIKLFVSLLRSSFDDLNEKGYKKFRQRVTQEDWNLYLKTDKEWTVIESDVFTGTNIIECSLGSAVGCICRGFGWSAVK
jgi:hypothetical protein